MLVLHTSLECPAMAMPDPLLLVLCLSRCRRLLPDDKKCSSYPKKTCEMRCQAGQLLLLSDDSPSSGIKFWFFSIFSRVTSLSVVCIGLVSRSQILVARAVFWAEENEMALHSTWYSCAHSILDTSHPYEKQQQ